MGKQLQEIKQLNVALNFFNTCKVKVLCEDL